MAETTTAEMNSTTEQPAPITFKKRGARARKNFRERREPSPVNSDSGSDSETGPRAKRAKKDAGILTASSASQKLSSQDLSATVFTADRNAAITSANDATKQSNWFDDNTQDGPLVKRPSGPSKGAQKDTMPDGTYKGLANQTSFIQKNPDAPNRSVGPMKAPTNVRTTTVTDYAPDVCKDYKTSGWCGFGDSCKFVHDRSDYKQGWQLDREWETVTKGKQIRGTVVASADRGRAATDGNDDENDDDAILENIPFKCIICMGPYREPIVTRCGHYFCEPCALKRYRRDPSCAACGGPTNGVFNSAKKLKKLLEKKAERAAQRRREAIEAGEEVSEDEDEGGGED